MRAGLLSLHNGQGEVVDVPESFTFMDTTDRKIRKTIGFHAGPDRNPCAAFERSDSARTGFGPRVRKPRVGVNETSRTSPLYTTRSGVHACLVLSVTKDGPASAKEIQKVRRRVLEIQKRAKKAGAIAADELCALEKCRKHWEKIAKLKTAAMHQRIESTLIMLDALEKLATKE